MNNHHRTKVIDMVVHRSSLCPTQTWLDHFESPKWHPLPKGRSFNLHELGLSGVGQSWLTAGRVDLAKILQIYWDLKILNEVLSDLLGSWWDLIKSGPNLIGENLILAEKHTYQGRTTHDLWWWRLVRSVGIKFSCNE